MIRSGDKEANFHTDPRRHVPCVCTCLQKNQKQIVNKTTINNRKSENDEPRGNLLQDAWCLWKLKSSVWSEVVYKWMGLVCQM